METRKQTSKKQVKKRIIEHIRKFQNLDDGDYPLVKDLYETLGISRQYFFQIVKELIEEGVLRKEQVEGSVKVVMRHTQITRYFVNGEEEEEEN